MTSPWTDDWQERESQRMYDDAMADLDAKRAAEFGDDAGDEEAACDIEHGQIWRRRWYAPLILHGGTDGLPRRVKVIHVHYSPIDGTPATVDCVSDDERELNLPVWRGRIGGYRLSPGEANG